MRPLTDFLNFGNIFFNEKTYPPETIRASIDAVAENLTKRFVSNSPFVYLFAPNHIKTVYGLFGVIKAGKVCVLVDPKLGRFELEEMIEDSPPGALIRIDEETDEFDFFKEFEFRHYQLAPTRIQGLDDVAIMLYTAADDGFAKGAMLTHENILANARAIIEGKQVGINSVSCSPISFHHLFALQTSIVAPNLVAGSTLISEITAPVKTKKTIQEIIKYGVTHFYAVPLVYYIMCKDNTAEAGFKNIKVLVSGGYKLSQSVFDKFYRMFGIEILEGYGLSEATLAITWHKPGEKVKITSVGRPFLGCEIKIVNEKNSEVPFGQTGEICVRSQTVMKGYFNNEVATNKIITGGWLFTGDIGSMDVDGFIYLKTPKKRMLNLCGNKVYPAELERLMKKHNNVLSVEVSGEPEELLGDIVKAKVRLRNNNAETQKIYKEWCMENITKYKVPRKFNFPS